MKALTAIAAILLALATPVAHHTHMEAVTPEIHPHVKVWTPPRVEIKVSQE